MKTILIVTIFLFLAGCVPYGAYTPTDTYIIRQNTAYGTPDYFQKGVIVQETVYGSTIYQESIPGTGQIDYFAPSYSIIK